jgi:hypothetical protein
VVLQTAEKPCTSTDEVLCREMQCAKTSLYRYMHELVRLGQIKIQTIRRHYPAGWFNQRVIELIEEENHAISKG